jgi:hypothetical protein
MNFTTGLSRVCLLATVAWLLRTLWVFWDSCYETLDGRAVCWSSYWSFGGGYGGSTLWSSTFGLLLYLSLPVAAIWVARWIILWVVAGFTRKA